MTKFVETVHHCFICDDNAILTEPVDDSKILVGSKIHERIKYARSLSALNFNSINNGYTLAVEDEVIELRDATEQEETMLDIFCATERDYYLRNANFLLDRAVVGDSLALKEYDCFVTLIISPYFIEVGEPLQRLEDLPHVRDIDIKNAALDIIFQWSQK